MSAVNPLSAVGAPSAAPAPDLSVVVPLFDEAESLRDVAGHEARERLRWQLRAAGNLTGGPEGERPTKRDRRKLDRLRREGGLD